MSQPEPTRRIDLPTPTPPDPTGAPAPATAPAATPSTTPAATPSTTPATTRGSGKRAGARRAAAAAKGPNPWLVLGAMTLGTLLCVAAWALLVYGAIREGRQAREAGSAQHWLLMAGATVLAMACLGGALWLGSQLLKLVGWPRRR